jgi:hypothetical protein
MRGQPAGNVGAESMWLQIDTPPEPGYTGDVVILVARIGRTPSGRALLDGIRDSGGSVKIEMPAVTDPPNATVGRQSSVPTPPSPASGVKPDWYIGFHPEDWPSPLDKAARPPEVVLFLLLREALARLRAGSNADAPRVFGDPDPEEEAAIATFQREVNGQ